MDLDADNFVPSKATLVGWIETTGENGFVDIKGPMTWDRCSESASLAKDIAAFANSRDGGILVIGKSERDGQFSYDGLTSTQLASFDSTKVAQWMQSRFAPVPRFTCYQVPYLGKNFVVIVVREFDDIPIICTKNFESQSNKRPLLKVGTIYVRGHSAESKPIETVDELRELVGLATKKKQNDLVKHLQAILKGKPIWERNDETDQAELEIQRVKEDLQLSEISGWFISITPISSTSPQWNRKQQLESIIFDSIINGIRQFPLINEIQPYAWGIAEGFSRDFWALTYSGIFLLWRELTEDQIPCPLPESQGQFESRSLEPGHWLEYTWTISTLAQVFHFASRLSENFPAGQRLSIAVNLNNLGKRQLVSHQMGIRFSHGPQIICYETQFVKTIELTAEDLQTNWEMNCASVLLELFDLFSGLSISEATILKWIDEYKNHRI